ncbi:MAG TPA: Xaa-Pro dipeptidyl-peptidase [Nocardioidaceae bacterium]|nr:Xaa-Pro dipeptidyl-peptidase [Nocardioidaceae bacterium]
MSLRRTCGIGVTALTVCVTAALAATVAQPAAADDVQQPVFVDGMAQPVFSSNAQDWVVEELWVTSDVDSDGDGALDRVHVDVTRPAETEQGLDVPVVYEASPYYAGGNPITNHDVHHELYAPSRPGQGWPGAATWGRQGQTRRDVGPSVISQRYVSTWVPRGFAVVHAESLGSGASEGCPTSGGSNETAGAKAVVDWLNGRATAVDAGGDTVEADWTTGQVGMLGTSYNGTLPNAVASTGVEGLEAIVPVSAISSWYDYYRAEGMVRAPGGFQGEDTDVLAEYVYTRDDRDVCRPVIESLVEEQDRVTGDYSSFWAERDYLRDVEDVRAATLVAHGLQDWNVMTRHAAQWYQALKEQGVAHKVYWHQGGHGGMPPADVLNRWFTRYLYDVDNGVEDEPRALVEREDDRLVEYAEWPVPGSEPVAVGMRPLGGGATGDLALGRQRQGGPNYETFTDVPTLTMAELAAAPDPEHGLVYTSPVLTEPVHVSGTPVASVRVQLGQRAANLTVGLVDLAPDGSVTRVVTEGWRDPQNRRSLSTTQVVKPGTPYDLDVTMQASDYVFAPGHRIAAVVMQSEEDFTILPPAGNVLSLDTGSTVFRLPVVGGESALAGALG